MKTIILHSSTHFLRGMTPKTSLQEKKTGKGSAVSTHDGPSGINMTVFSKASTFSFRTRHAETELSSITAATHFLMNASDKGIRPMDKRPSAG